MEGRGRVGERNTGRIKWKLKENRGVKVRDFMKVDSKCKRVIDRKREIEGSGGEE